MLAGKRKNCPPDPSGLPAEYHVVGTVPNRKRPLFMLFRNREGRVNAAFWGVEGGYGGAYRKEALVLEYIVTNYGYPALFVGTFLEGETILIIAGIAAFEGFIDIRLAIITAFAGTMLGDSFNFFVGRMRGEWLLQRVPRWRTHIDRILLLMDRHSVWLVLTFRYMYAVRNFTSIAVGMSHTPTWMFLSLNAVGAAFWAVSFGMGGYVFGEVLIAVVKDIKSYEMHLLAGACLAGLLFWLYRFLRRRQKNRKNENIHS